MFGIIIIDVCYQFHTQFMQLFSEFTKDLVKIMISGTQQMLKLYGKIFT